MSAQEELVCDPEAGWLCGRDACAIGDDLDGVKWFPAGGDCMLAQQGGLLVEYSVEVRECSVCRSRSRSRTATRWVRVGTRRALRRGLVSRRVVFFFAVSVFCLEEFWRCWQSPYPQTGRK